MAKAKSAVSSEAEGMEEDLVQSVYHQIKDSILGNRLRPGNKLTHQALAEMLGVSRTPVRESLERLYQEGYVTRIPNRGHFVAEIDAREVRELYETREALESYAVQLIFRKGIAPAAGKRLGALNERYKLLCQDKLTRERLLMDREFHMALAEEAGNQYLSKTLGSVFDRLILKRRVEGFQDLRGVDPYNEHVALLAALDSNDEAAAQNVLRDHVGNASLRFANYLEVEQGPAMAAQLERLHLRA
ncbi:GntR family transcriptional regulator [Ramlibacter sp.]|uniref:GntR family transcriptional regulator n=1 Tax=Ramlibacter sp. TaxID=1917967 RepID=UPI003D0CAB37